MAHIPLIRVFLSSPGDVSDERAGALDVLEHLQYDPYLRGRAAFEVVAWDKPGADTPMLATVTPQEAINQGLPKPSECEIVVVILWARMGTPLPHPEYQKPDGSPYLSGTEWEFEDAMQAARGQGRPEVVVYRRTEDVQFNPRDAAFKSRLEQWERVEVFFAQFQDPETGAIRVGYNAYGTPEELRQKLEGHLRTIVKRLLEPPKPPEVRSAAETHVEPREVALPPPPALWQGSPFPGLRAFTPGDAPIFFGRGRETDTLVQRVGERRLVGVVGASGSGKSSLVGSGLIPRLKANAITGSKDWLLPDWNAEARQWIGLRFTPGEVGDNPFMALALKLAPLLGAAPRDLAASLAADPKSLETICTPLFGDTPPWAEALLFIDQFEELFTLAHPRYHDAFVELLDTTTVSERLRTVLTLRADFYARCVEVPKLADLLETATYPLAAPTSLELHEMIIRPAERAGLAFEAGLAERILADTGSEPGALALMAYALDELYHAGADHHQLTFAAYEALGGVQGAIGKRAEAVFSALDSEAQGALPTVFREIVEVDERGEPTRRRAALEVVAQDDAAKQLAEALTGERARLLMQDKDAQGRPMVEVAHEALLRQWPRLSAWIEKEQDNLRLRRQIQQATQEWDKRGRDPAYLLSGGRLADAQVWLEYFPADELARAFIAVSAEAEARRKEEERKIARRVQNFQRASAVLGVVAVIAVLATLGAGVAFVGANNQAATATVAQGEALYAQQTSSAREVEVAAEATVFSLRQEVVSTLAAGGAVIALDDLEPAPQAFVATVTAHAELLAWVPEVQEFDGVEMVLVPAGCFWMGSIISASEQPVHEVCFDEPFWIDRYEVTNARYGSKGCEDYSSQPSQPRNCVSWFEARDFCDGRDGDMDDPPEVGVRLPTEAEWEYAARGPNSLIYPWGNAFVRDNVVPVQNSKLPSQTAEVGSRPDGVSWVGADYMSGNVFEWVSTIYDKFGFPGEFPYPYDPADGREDMERTDVWRVMRGGSLYSDVRTAMRGESHPDNRDSFVGFRCTLSF